MPSEHAPKSNEESGPPEKNFVYDFLYHDVHRIGSFLSQFDPNGYLQSSTSSNSLSQNRTASSERSITGKLPALVEGKTAQEYSNSEINNDDTSRTYDPLWQNSLAFLDFLEQKDLINKSILNSHIGQFVLVSGKLFMFDMGFMQKLVHGKVLKQSIISSITGANNTKTEANLTMEIFAALPGSIQARLIGEDFSIWSTLRPDGLSLSTDDLLLKHGSFISGSWNILGILDALPDNDIPIDFSFLPGIQIGLADFSKIIRPQFGRSPDYFGITPLLVFREVSGN
jgi:hypothetical protein